MAAGIAAALALAGCALSPNSTNRPVGWPLKFKDHAFGSVCYSTLSCTVWYASHWHGDEKPSPPPSKYGPDYLRYVDGTHVGIRGSPKSAEVTWQSMDGAHHYTEIDLADIFRDRLIRHNVPREEVADQPGGQLVVDPSIILEVNDRTVRIYMRSSIPLKHLEDPTNIHSDMRRDLVLVKTYNF